MSRERSFYIQFRLVQILIYTDKSFTGILSVPHTESPKPLPLWYIS